MSKRNKIGPLCLSVVALSMGACSTSYDCSSSDVVDALVQEAATSGFVPHLNPAPAEWTTRLASHTKARNIVTLDEDEGTQHFRCRANLEYSEAARTVTSKDITYDVRKIEGEDDFSLEWEVPNDGIGDIDPIKLFAMDVQGPWKGPKKPAKPVLPPRRGCRPPAHILCSLFSSPLRTLFFAYGEPFVMVCQRISRYHAKNIFTATDCNN